MSERKDTLKKISGLMDRLSYIKSMIKSVNNQVDALIHSNGLTIDGYAGAVEFTRLRQQMVDLRGQRFDVETEVKMLTKQEKSNLRSELIEGGLPEGMMKAIREALGGAGATLEGVKVVGPDGEARNVPFSRKHAS